MNYWEKLSHLRVYSQERRRERYQICFLWKQSQGLVEGYSFNWQWSDRRGRLAIPTNIPSSAPTKVKQARERSLGVHGARLFNLLPVNIRNENSGDFPLFKTIWTFFCLWFLTNPQPQAWSGQQHPTACWIKSLVFLILTRFLLILSVFLHDA